MGASVRSSLFSGWVAFWPWSSERGGGGWARWAKVVFIFYSFSHPTTHFPHPFQSQDLPLAAFDSIRILSAKEAKEKSMHGLGRLFFILYEIFSTVCRDSFSWWMFFLPQLKIRKKFDGKQELYISCFSDKIKTESSRKKIQTTV